MAAADFKPFLLVLLFCCLVHVTTLVRWLSEWGIVLFGVPTSPRQTGLINHHCDASETSILHCSKTWTDWTNFSSKIQKMPKKCCNCCSHSFSVANWQLRKILGHIQKKYKKMRETNIIRYKCTKKSCWNKKNHKTQHLQFYTSNSYKQCIESLNYFKSFVNLCIVINWLRT